ncbi:succinyl-diaminopimelate desuccinylase [Actinoplanes octamycinicus]|uniref:Succinyl-diaminopimelate desuccinylase n=1 Tax=Actinoplanes octamycinicus TaxID=135948 RepID=A0A7W7GY23_9ACTN|nr:M20/M25/M40 family metallo-hydrolase [Actinoplanes octamycinicus]MBB4740425.1 succinyl-diaminopimelate desuccinylase [Actinoplanes octamycinicus]GIE59685.1 peptidase M20 [Actinoplanes octamycinicus]
MEELLAPLEALIGIHSTADRPGELHRALGLVLDLLGPGFEISRFESGGKPSALVTFADRPGRPRVILNAHLDVVPGTPDQFRPHRDGDRLYGRGTHDMKAAALVLATVFRELAGELPFPIALQLVTDEEVGGFDGTGHQLEAGVRGDFVIIGEQSGLRVVTESKGLVRARLIAPGQAAHAAYPWLGSNALLTLIAAVEKLLARYPLPAAEAWATTVNLARIETTNEAVNQVPADATAWLDIRYPPEDPDLTGRSPEQIEAHLRRITDSAVEVLVEAVGTPHRADPESVEVRALREAVRTVGQPGSLLRKHGAADSRFYFPLGVDAVIFGPTGDGQHGPSEYLEISSLRPYHDALHAFLRSDSLFRTGDAPTPTAPDPFRP